MCQFRVSSPIVRPCTPFFHVASQQYTSLQNLPLQFELASCEYLLAGDSSVYMFKILVSQAVGISKLFAAILFRTGSCTC